jgi:papain like protease
MPLNVRLNGCIYGPASERDFRTVFRNDSVPEKVDLRDCCTAVEDQGHIGSCTANAAVGAIEYHYKKRDGRAPDLSRLFVYFNSRRMRGEVMLDNGAQIREAMASLIAFGACREDLWPYNPELFSAEPPKDAYNDAQTHEAIQYARVDGSQGAIAALAKGLPVVFGCVIPQRCYEEATTTGLIPRPMLGEPVMGGHSMLIVGYDKGDRTFLVRNSWGEGWGERGYCRIPFDVMDACTRPEDFWVVAELEKQGGFELVRPARAAAPPRPPAAQAPPADRAAVGSSAAKMRDEIRTSLAADLAASSRKIDSLLGRQGTPAAATAAKVMPCTACTGTGTCPYCQGKKAGCVRCSGTGICQECGGAGVI